MTNAHATRQIQQKPITITPTSTVSVVPDESEMTEGYSKHEVCSLLKITH